MSVFVVCSATVAAGLAVAFEVGRVAEKRLSGTSKLALPFEGFDLTSESAKTAAYVFVTLFFVEVLFLPRSLNPFWYLTSRSSNSSSLLAFLVFGSWSGILAVGFGGIAASLQALRIERRALDDERSHLESARSQANQRLEQEQQKMAKAQRIHLASAAAVAGEWKKLHIAREEDLHRSQERSENEKIWSSEIAKNFDKKVMHVVDNATDQRWREIQDQDLTLEAMRYRNKQKEQRLKEQRALRAERTNSEKETLRNETSKLLQMTDELEGLKSNMEKLKEENKKKEQEKIRELKERELALTEKEKDLEESHLQKLEKLKEQEKTLKSKEEEFESGEEHKKLQELSEKLESSKLTVARFNEEVMKKEREKLEEFRSREEELKRREEEFSKMAITTNNYMEAPDDEVDLEDKSVSIRLLTEREIQPDLSKDASSKHSSSRDNSSKDLPKIQEDTVDLVKQSGESVSDLSSANKTPEGKSFSSHSIKLLAEQVIQDDESPLDEKNPEENQEPSPVSLMDLDDDEDDAKDEKEQENTTLSTPEENLGHDFAVVEECTGDESLLDLDHEDDESTASSCLLNVNANNDYKEAGAEDRNDVSDNESLSHQIRQDIAAVEQEESWNVETSVISSMISSTAEDAIVPGPLSPLTERIKNRFFGGNTATAKREDAIPKSPTSGSNEALTINQSTSDPDYVVLKKAEQENAASVSGGRKNRRKAAPSKKKSKDKKSLVVSEEAAVEVIAWSDPGPY